MLYHCLCQWPLRETLRPFVEQDSYWSCGSPLWPHPHLLPTSHPCYFSHTGHLMVSWAHQACFHFSSTLFSCLEHYIFTWLTPVLHLRLLKMLPPKITFKVLLYLASITRISISSAHDPFTCYHSLASPEIVYVYTRTCEHTHIHILI